MRLSLALLLCLTGCAPTHVGSYIPKHREYELPSSSARVEPTMAPGSLWRGDQPASMLFTDARALREQDLLVVKIEEIADSNRNADTDLGHSTDFGIDIAAFLKLAGVSSGDVEAKLGTKFESGFRGIGKTRRTERLTATVPALVRKVLPNGNLFIEGHRVVLVNNEEQHFYISGVVRPIDIAQDNSVLSSYVADAEIEFTGRGVLTDNQKPGILARFFSWIWPF